MKGLVTLALAAFCAASPAMANSVDDTLDRLWAQLGHTGKRPVSSPVQQSTDAVTWYIAIPGDLGRMNDFRCEEETTGPAEFIRIQRSMHTVDVHDTVDPITGKVVETSLMIADSTRPFVMYRGRDRCEAALAALEAGYAAKRAAQQTEDAKYQ